MVSVRDREIMSSDLGLKRYHRTSILSLFLVSVMRMQCVAADVAVKADQRLEAFFQQKWNSCAQHKRFARKREAVVEPMQS